MTGPQIVDLTIDTDDGAVSGLLRHPADAWCLCVLAHGAGAGMRHAFLETLAERLARWGVGTVRYQFPYMERGKRRPDPPAVAQRTVRAAAAQARALAPGLPLLAGGKSFGGRMTSQAAAAEPLEGVVGLVFLGFPLHPAGRPGDERAHHLQHVSSPMLFLQGTRDALADLDLMRQVCSRLGERATLHVVDGGDHSFKVPKRSGRTADHVFDDVADTMVAWGRALTSGRRTPAPAGGRSRRPRA